MTESTTCAFCGWRDAVSSVREDGRVYRCCAKCRPGEMAHKTSGAPEVIAAIGKLGQGTISQIAELFGGKWDGTAEQQGTYSTVRNAVQRLAALGVVAAVGKVPGSRGRTKFYSLTGKQWVDRRATRYRKEAA